MVTVFSSCSVVAKLKQNNFMTKGNELSHIRINLSGPVWCHLSCKYLETRSSPSGFKAFCQMMLCFFNYINFLYKVFKHGFLTWCWKVEFWLVLKVKCLLMLLWCWCVKMHNAIKSIKISLAAFKIFPEAA